MADTRRDRLHKESTRIIRDSQAVYVEDLCVSGLGRTRLAKSVHDAGWAAFAGMLADKARRGCQWRMLMARAITRAPIPRDTAPSLIMSSLAHGLIADMSVGLNAVAVQKPSDR